MICKIKTLQSVIVPDGDSGGDGEEEEEEYEDGFYDNEDDSLVQNEIIVASDHAYYESDEDLSLAN